MDAQIPTVDKNGTVRLPSFDVPLSAYMSEQARRAFIEESGGNFAKALNSCVTIGEARAVVDEHYAPIVARAKEVYAVTEQPDVVAGVRVDIVTPANGPSEKDRNRILINLHAGAFQTGAGLAGLAESIPIASVSRVPVMSLHYRLAPESVFPAASQDVAAVYEKLLERYEPQNIGLYGCSAGGLLAAEAIVWFQEWKLPTPGGIGIFCAGLDPAARGDSSYSSTQLNGAFLSAPPRSTQALEPPSMYFSVRDLDNHLAFPILNPRALGKFPPSLFVVGTRDPFMSSAVYAHTQLCKAGVDARLHVWDGMWHGFLINPDMPEAREAHREISKFFGWTLGNRRSE